MWSSWYEMCSGCTARSEAGGKSAPPLLRPAPSRAGSSCAIDRHGRREHWRAVHDYMKCCTFIDFVHPALSQTYGNPGTNLYRPCINSYQDYHILYCRKLPWQRPGRGRGGAGGAGAASVLGTCAATAQSAPRGSRRRGGGGRRRHRAQPPLLARGRGRSTRREEVLKALAPQGSCVREGASCRAKARRWCWCWCWCWCWGWC